METATAPMVMCGKETRKAASEEERLTKRLEERNGIRKLSFMSILKFNRQLFSQRFSFLGLAMISRYASMLPPPFYIGSNAFHHMNQLVITPLLLSSFIVGGSSISLIGGAIITAKISGPALKRSFICLTCGITLIPFPALIH